MEMLFPVLIGAVICLVVLFAIYAAAQAKKRREDLARIAAEMGLRYDPNDPFGLPQRFGNLGLLGQGHSRSAQNVLFGKFGDHDVKAFDYLYYTTETSTDSKGNTTTREVSHYFSATIFETDVVFPSLLIRPENFFDKIAAAFGFDDINFESAEFSRKFYVKSSDKKFAYDVIHPRMMEFLLAQPRWSLHLEGSVVLVCKGGTHTPEEFRTSIQFTDGFLKQFPDFVWQELQK